ncbi:MAG: glycosyltransferase [Lachnospiraceae bacterium]|nr:glycosyltransferase [Lachnospiraceae bacterium]
MGKVEPLISVIIPVYNVVRYLDECIESVCDQTHKMLEIILVDDGSTDGSSELCDKWKEKDDRILVIHKENGGLSTARNMGLDIASGEYIGFVDSDDTIEPRMYECLLQALEQSTAELVVCAYKAVDEKGNPYRQIYEDVPDCTLSIQKYLEMMNQNVRIHCEFIGVWNKLYRRSMLEGIRFRDGVIHEDDFFLNSLLPRIKNINILHTKFYNYRQRGGSIMHEKFSEKRLVYFYALQERVKICEDMSFEGECLRAVACECINSGVRFWVLLSLKRIVDAEKISKYYQDVLMVKRKYFHYGTLKQKVFWSLFDYMPGVMKTMYRCYKAIKK